MDLVSYRGPRSGSECTRRLCDPLPQYDFIMSVVTLPCLYSTSSATSLEFIENLAACI